MENNKKIDIRKSLMAILLVLVTAMVVLLGTKSYFMDKEIIELRAQLQEIKENSKHVEECEQTLPSKETSPVATGEETQVVSSAVVIEKPDVILPKEPEAAHKVYLTFDDGPSKYTEDILDILDEYNVKATFFVVGKEGEESKKRLEMIRERGHSIGMHSYSHDYTDIYESLGQFRSDFLKSKKYLYDTLGIESNFYRFPGGSSNALSDLSMQVFIDFLEEQGVEYYDWNISSGDGSSTLMPAEIIVENCTKSIEKYGTAIILMHDAASKPTTVEALPQIIEAIQAMEDTIILPITEASQSVHHAIKEKETDTKPKE